MSIFKCLVNIVFGIALLYPTLKVSAQNAPQLGKNSIAEVVKAMTLEEKVSLVVGKGLNMPGITQSGTGVGETLDRVAGAGGTTRGIPRLGIPSTVVADGPAGVRIDPTRKDQPGKTYYATGWPVATLLASSWDTTVLRNVGVAFGEEVKDYGIDIILGPAMNIHRNPLGGRNFEYYSEDPLVTGKMASSIVKGIQSNSIGTSVKHFAANNQETNRNTVNSIVSERALREIYLKGFEIVVKESQPWTVMSSYNLLNGTYTSENPELLNRILRDEWGFKGYVMSDWFGGKDASAQMKAGNNLLMPGVEAQEKAILTAVKAGTLSEKVLDKNVEEILNIILRLPSFQNYKYSDVPDLKKHAEISRIAATQGMVLLKNESMSLPLSQGKNLALFGNFGYDLIAGGLGSGDVHKAYTISLAEGLVNAGYTIDKDLNETYIGYLNNYKENHPKKAFFQEFLNPTPPANEYVLDKNLVTKKAGSTDLAVIVLGRNAGEGRDRKVADDYELTDVEMEMIKTVSTAYHAQHKKLVIVLNIGGVINVMPWRDYADAILLAWQPGIEGGNAIADVLSGKVNPSGKLATTFPVAYNDIASSKNFPGKEFLEKATDGMFGIKAIPAEVTYEEGIYIGYRYFNSFNIKTAYEFGFGLSYTNFDYTNLKLSSQNFNGTLKASVTITNNGKVAGKEVVQLYLTAPKNKIDKPSEELKSFGKTELLQPGQSQTLTFTIKPIDLASFNTSSLAWIADAGKYILKVGASSLNIKQSDTFNLSKDIVVEKVNKVLVPQVPINELKSK